VRTHFSQVPQFVDKSATSQQTFTALVAIGSFAITATFFGSRKRSSIVDYREVRLNFKAVGIDSPSCFAGEITPDQIRLIRFGDEVNAAQDFDRYWLMQAATGYMAIGLMP
jgi:hypothetical protein